MRRRTTVKSLLNKELRLSAHILSWLFLAFSLMVLIPGYPILVGAFFVCFGIFQTFQNGRETNDVLYTVLLPVEKGDAVRARFLFVCFIQILALVCMAVLTALRMTLLGKAEPYVNNPMMNSNLVFLGYTALVFALFNGVFVGPFFKTAYKFGKPFVTFIVLAFVLIAAAETLHHIPGLEFLNGNERLGIQSAILIVSFAVYALATLLSCRRAVRVFEKVDL